MAAASAADAVHGDHGKSVEKTAVEDAVDDILDKIFEIPAAGLTGFVVKAYLVQLRETAGLFKDRCSINGKFLNSDFARAAPRGYGPFRARARSAGRERA
jgi:hypothetical protein